MKFLFPVQSAESRRAGINHWVVPVQPGRGEHRSALHLEAGALDKGLSGKDEPLSFCPNNKVPPHDLTLDVINAPRYYIFMILSFKCKETEKIWQQTYSKRFPVSIQRIALRKLFMLQRAKELKDLTIPPANRLEKLKGDRKDQYSIRINDQFRICFIWENSNALEVEIVDYH